MMLLPKRVRLYSSIFPSFILRNGGIEENGFWGGAARSTRSHIITTTWPRWAVPKYTALHWVYLCSHIRVISLFLLRRDQWNNSWRCMIVWCISKFDSVLNKWFTVLFPYILQRLPSLILARHHTLEFFPANPFRLIMLSPLRSRK